MNKWLKLAAEMEAETINADSANSANSLPNGTIGINGTALPASIIMGLRSLRGHPPRGVEAPGWHEIVADARRLEGEGWAVTALALGWSALDLFGMSNLREGLAVWLAGREILLLDAGTAIVESGERRAQFTRCRRGMPGAKFLWEMH